MDFIIVKDCRDQMTNDAIRLRDVQLIKVDGGSKPLTEFVYFVQPCPSLYPLNLSIGFDEHKYLTHTHEVDRKMYRMESLVMSEDENPEGVKYLDKIDVFAKQSVLIQIMMFPFHIKYQKYQVKATKYGNKIYLIGEKGQMTVTKSTAKPMHVYQFKCRQYCFADKPEGSTNVDEPSDENKAIFATFQAKLMEFNLMYTGCIHGIQSDEIITDFDDKNQLSQCKVVIAKVIPDFAFGGYQNYRMFDLINQACLNSIKDIYLCQAKKNGTVRRPIKLIKAERLENTQEWKVSHCLNFLYKFLTDLKILMADVDCPHTTYIFQYDLEHDKIIYDKHEGKTEHSFLSDEYVEFLMQRKK